MTEKENKQNTSEADLIEEKELESAANQADENEAKSEAADLESQYPKSDNAESESDFSKSELADISSKSQSKKKKAGGAHAKKAQSALMQKSTRMRKVLIFIILLLIALIAGLVFYVAQIILSTQDIAVQQTNISETNEIESTESEKNIQSNVKKTTVPSIVSLIGQNLDSAVAQIGHGAEITRTLEVNEEGSPIKQDVQVALTEEPSDTRSGTPTVYLSLDEGGIIVQVGYSASTSSLGYGSLSFSDAVQNEHVVEETLDDAGLTVNFGTAKLPENKAEYSTYDTDGTTLVKEYCNFAGVGTAQGIEYQWESILSYDYSMANATDNLNDTIRTIYVYISR